MPHLQHDVFWLELPDRFDVVVEPGRLLVERERIIVLRLLLELRTRSVNRCQCR